jgi:Arm DNA-binding domain
MAEQKRRVAKRLNAAFVRTAKTGFWPDGDGLYLRVDSNGNRRWVFVSQKGGKRREMGLGPARDVSLAEARQRPLRPGGPSPPAAIRLPNASGPKAKKAAR